MHLRLTGVVDVNEWVSVVDEVLGFTDLWKPMSDFLLVSHLFLHLSKTSEKLTMMVYMVMYVWISVLSKWLFSSVPYLIKWH